MFISLLVRMYKHLCEVRCACVCLLCAISCRCATRVSRHICLHLHLFVKNNKNKGGWQLCWMETVSVIVKPRGATYTIFLAGKSNIGVIYAAELATRWRSARACLWHRGIWYKAYKKSCLKERMFISFTNRMSSFSPTESEKDVMLLVWRSAVCFFWGVCLCFCKSVFETRSQHKAPKTSQFI